MRKCYFPAISQTTLFASIIVALSLAITACGENDAELAKFDDPIPEVVDFNYDVKPILSDTCYLCHGPDLPNNKAGLSLSSFEAATAHMTESEMNALKPGNAKLSEAYLRIVSDDPNYMMPPPESNLVLSDRDKAVIKRWIEQGAEYKKHWAFITPESAEVPDVKSSNATESAINNDIDHFVQKTLSDKGFNANERADKETLIRRVTFDLTGLPPTLDEIDEFLDDTDVTAFEKVVDRLLATQAYGERMATEWLDVARYADTHGYSTDFYRDMSPYRDWVISAFNENQAFDEFVTWQVAGDLLEKPSTEQLIATAFNRVHAQNGEGGVVNEEFRVEYVKDRVQTIGTGLLGMTMHCAQCHDHKYDPISAEDYYSTYAFFNNVDESGQISYDPNDMPVPTLMLPTESEKAKLEEYDTQLTKMIADINQRHGADTPSYVAWKNNQLASQLTEDQSALRAYFPLSLNDSNASIQNAIDSDANGRVLYGAKPNKKNGPAMVHVKDGGREAIKLNGDDPLYFPSINDIERAKPFSLSIDANIPAEIEEGVLVHYNKAGILYNFKGFDIGIEGNRWLVRFAHTYPDNAIVLTSEEAVVRDSWINVALTYDGSSKADGLGFYIDGQAIPMAVEFDNLYKDIQHTREGVRKEIGIKIGARWRSRGTPNTLVDNFKFYHRDLTAIEIAKQYAADDATVIAQAQTPDNLLATYNERFNPSYVKDKQALTALRQEMNGFVEQIREIMVMKEGKPKQAYILDRGSYASHGKPVSKGVPEAFFPWNDAWPNDRRGLAAWLTDPAHPLVPRVVVNRYWQLVFGKGLVTTPEDFGNQGKLPSHPALLDWLARDFVDNGWDIKRLMKMLVMSATYQQSSIASPELLEKDPENTWLARGPSSRLSAEMIRDNALASSGLLIDKVGGESVRPYQPEGIWKMNNKDYVRGEGEHLYRRSMYTIFKRSAPPPNMTAFDAATRAHSVGVRQQTSTPLQALALLNDPQIVEASRVMAQRVLEAQTEEGTYLASIYRQLTSRVPSTGELAVINEMYESVESSFKDSPDEAQALLAVGDWPVNEKLDSTKLAALASVTNMLMNHDASVIKR